MAEAPAGPPPLTEDQIKDLLEKKRAYAAENGDADNACQNAKCRCVQCTCGAACTCNISPEVTCDPCKELKAAVAAKQTNAARLAEAEELWQNIESKYSDLKHVDSAEIALRQKETPDAIVLVDCRPKEETDVSIVAGAVSLGEFEANVEALSKDKMVVVYCTVGGRSAGVVRRLKEASQQPWTEIANWKLSIVGWCHINGKLQDADGNDTRKVFCPAGRVGDMFPVDFEVVSA